MTSIFITDEFELAGGEDGTWVYRQWGWRTHQDEDRWTVIKTLFIGSLEYVIDRMVTDATAVTEAESLQELADSIEKIRATLTAKCERDLSGTKIKASRRKNRGTRTGGEQ